MNISQTLEVVLPPYQAPRTEWRKRIHSAVVAALPSPDAAYAPTDRLVIIVELRMSDSMLRFHDVDNRLKDVLDALQGRVGGTKAKRGKLRPVVPNDWQVFEATVRKAPADSRSEGGRLTIRRDVRR